jgi:outer membrane protein OmpA-like peptidoglycan-associated protein
MKKILSILLLLSFMLVGVSPLQAQFFKKLKEKAENEAVDKATDKAIEAIFEGDNSSDKKSDKNKASESSQSSAKSEKAMEDQTSPKLNWAKFDFVPGDKVIFTDGPDQSEENGEFPSRWDLRKGTVEIAEVDGEKVIMFRDGTPEIIPYMKNPKKDYLPETFTIEFDYYRPADGGNIYLYLYDRKNQKRPKGESHIWVSYNEIKSRAFGSKYPSKIVRKKGKWTHVSIAYTKGKLKAYFDDVRLVNIPRLEFEPTGFSISCYNATPKKLYYLKNVRIAKGGVKYYDRVLSEGKIVVNGIRFDVGKATLLPESMGPINEICDLMKKHKNVKFSVEGHTDSDGQSALNRALSQDRAKTVMNKLIEMGIDKSRLKSKGWGESKPIDNNSTPEGKANNRRVEFVKI